MKPEFCPDCGAPVTENTHTLYLCPNGHEYYNNPRASTAVIFWKDGQALFSKRAFEPGKGKYDFPGGFLEYNEAAVDGAIREIAEETTVQVQPADLHLLTVYNGEYTVGTSVADVVFVAVKWQGDFVPQDDSAALEWHHLSLANGPQSNINYTDLEEKVAELLKRLGETT